MLTKELTEFLKITNNDCLEKWKSVREKYIDTPNLGLDWFLQLINSKFIDSLFPNIPNEDFDQFDRYMKNDASKPEIIAFYQYLTQPGNLWLNLKCSQLLKGIFDELFKLLDHRHGNRFSHQEEFLIAVGGLRFYKGLHGESLATPMAMFEYLTGNHEEFVNMEIQSLQHELLICAMAIGKASSYKNDYKEKKNPTTFTAIESFLNITNPGFVKSLFHDIPHQETKAFLDYVQNPNNFQTVRSFADYLFNQGNLWLDTKCSPELKEMLESLLVRAKELAGERFDTTDSFLVWLLGIDFYQQITKQTISTKKDLAKYLYGNRGVFECETKRSIHAELVFLEEQFSDRKFFNGIPRRSFSLPLFINHILDDQPNIENRLVITTGDGKRLKKANNAFKIGKVIFKKNKTAMFSFTLNDSDPGTGANGFLITSDTISLPPVSLPGVSYSLELDYRKSHASMTVDINGSPANLSFAYEPQYFFMTCIDNSDKINLNKLSDLEAIYCVKIDVETNLDTMPDLFYYDIDCANIEYELLAKQYVIAITPSECFFDTFEKRHSTIKLNLNFEINKEWQEDFFIELHANIWTMDIRFIDGVIKSSIDDNQQHDLTINLNEIQILQTTFAKKHEIDITQRLISANRFYFLRVLCDEYPVSSLFINTKRNIEKSYDFKVIFALLVVFVIGLNNSSGVSFLAVFALLIYMGYNIKAMQPIITPISMGRINLNKLDLSNIDMSGEDFSSKPINKVNFSNSILANSDFSNCSIVQTSAQSTVFEDSVFHSAKLKKFKCNHAVCTCADFQDAIIHNASFKGCNFSMASFRGATLIKTDFRKADLSNADFREATLTKVNLLGANITGAKFDPEYRRQHLKKCHLKKKQTDKSEFFVKRHPLVQIARFLLLLVLAAIPLGYFLTPVQTKIRWGLPIIGSLSRLNLVNADLSHCTLADADLTQTNLSNAILVGANLTGAILSNTCLYGADLSRASFKGVRIDKADLRKARLNNAFLMGARLSDTDLRLAVLSGANFSKATFTRVSLQGSFISNTDFQNAKFKDISLSGIIFINSSFQNADFSSAVIDGANFSNAKLNNASMKGTCLSNVVFINADLQDALLIETTLYNANLIGANLLGANFFKADVENAIIEKKWKEYFLQATNNNKIIWK